MYKNKKSDIAQLSIGIALCIRLMIVEKDSLIVLISTLFLGIFLFCLFSKRGD